MTDEQVIIQITSKLYVDEKFVELLLVRPRSIPSSAVSFSPTLAGSNGSKSRKVRPES